MFFLKNIFFSFIALFVVCGNSCLAATFAKDLRIKTNINREWKFELGDHPGAEKASYVDAEWQNVGLPHTFSLPYFLSSDFYTGYGWYRKTINVDHEIGSRQFNLEFEGVFQVAEVYVNGIFAGKHSGGYNGFSIDVTKKLHKGNNLIAIRVNNIWNAQLAPRAGEHVFSGGIYRDVWLVETGPVHVTWYGTCVTTPELSDASGKVTIKTEISNEGKTAFNGILKTSIIDPDGREVSSMSTKYILSAGQTQSIDQTSSIIANPRLWSPQTPVLYKVVSVIFDKDQPVDRYETTFGMRWFNWTADKGFFLNGKHYYFKGCNVHQDHAGWGDGVTNVGFARDVRMMKDAGFDFIRGSHYPHDPAFSDACDSIGMLFWSENCFWGIGGFKPEGDWTCSAYPTIEKDERPFEESVKASLKEMIRIHRNHPSIVVWSMCNEPFFTAKETMPKVKTFLKDLIALTHSLDPSRSAAIGGCQRGDIDTIGDVAGYNGDGARLFIKPRVASVVSEYGSTIADRPGEYIPGYGELQEEQFDWRSGQAIWCGFDHGSVAGHFGCMGVVDYFRLPKRQWYWYRNAYKNIPPDKCSEAGVPTAIRLSADKTTIEHADGTDDVHLIATIVDKNGIAISNSPNVKLEIISGPGEFPTGSSILFEKDSDIAIRDGKAAIEFRSYYAGTTVIRASSLGLSSDEITIFSKGAPAFVSTKNKVTQRPYIRFTSDRTDKSDEQKINLLSERPTMASSATAEHSSRLANDNDDSTCWEPIRKATVGDWWQVDMENIYSLAEIKLTFKDEIVLQYKIEISMDGKKWTPLIDRTSNVEKIRTRNEIIKEAIKGRFLRITFNGSKVDQLINIADIQAFGK